MQIWPRLRRVIMISLAVAPRIVLGVYTRRLPYAAYGVSVCLLNLLGDSEALLGGQEVIRAREVLLRKRHLNRSVDSVYAHIPGHVALLSEGFGRWRERLRLFEIFEDAG